jgi:hypothetical protein
MIRQRLVQVITQKPPNTEPVSGQAQELAFGANVRKEHDQLQCEEDPRIDTWPPHTGSVTVLRQVAHEAESQHAIHVTREVVSGDQLVKGARVYRREEPCFGAHQRTLPFGVRPVHATPGR